MKFKELLLGVSALTLIGAATTSCTNEMVSPYPGHTAGNSSSMLVHAPDVYAWSGDQNLNSTRSGFTRAFLGEETKGVTAVVERSGTLDRDNAANIADEYLPEESINIGHIDTDFLFYAKEDTDLYFYPVIMRTSDSPKDIGIFYYDKQGQLNSEIVWSDFNVYNYRFESNPYTGLKISVKKGYKFGFFITGEQKSKTYYSSSEMNEGAYAWSGAKNYSDYENQLIKTHAGVFESENMTFFCFEDWTDFDFQDIVFAFTTVVSTVSQDNTEWGKNDDGSYLDDDVTPPSGDNCGVCGHPSHDGDCEVCQPGESACHPAHTCPKCDHPAHGDGPCDQCGENEGCNKKDENPGGNTGGDNTGHDDILSEIYHNDEVEINFSINDSHTSGDKAYDYADLWTKLSIHVRKATDVKVFIPLPGYYLCESDDFAILQDHLEGNNIYTGDAHDALEHFGETHSLTYHIEKDATTSWDVTLSVTIANEGITVTTSGIEQEGLIEYLMEKNGDGINFEIWNYFQTETVDWVDGQKHIGATLGGTDYEAFQGYLDQSTVEFTKNPSFYINAYGYEWKDGTFSTRQRERDCLVTPKYNTQFDMFENYCLHLNGTPWNIVWTRSNVDKSSDDYKAHHVTADPAVRVDKYDNK